MQRLKPFQIVSLGEKLKMPKTCQNPFYKNIRVVLWKNRSKKHQIFGKWDDFENRESYKAYSPCKRYSLCKMLSLGENLKKTEDMAKTVQHQHYSCSICAKNRSKKHQIFKKWDNFQNRKFCKGLSACKGYSFCKMVSLGQKLKMPKTCQKPLYKNIRVVLCKKAFETTPNIREMRRFWKSAILQRL